LSILVTGGAGYIGSHTCIELLNAGFEIVVLDYLFNSKEESINRIKEIAGKDFKFYQVNLLEKSELEKVFSENNIEAVIHLSGLKAVGESVSSPLKYYHNNLTGTLILCEVMETFNVRKIVVSSSATVYGAPKKVPISENAELNATNPYGRSKLMMEEIFKDLAISDNRWCISILRYFNPIGAHPSGRIGEEPNGIPNNLMPYISQVAIGKLKELKVFGNDYPTKDGTGVRDYIHITDLAVGHLKALKKVMEGYGISIYNLGTGIGYSVFEMINVFEKVSGKQIPYSIVERRPGDVAECYADPTKANEELGWTAQKGIEEMCLDTWNWQSKNKITAKI